MALVKQFNQNQLLAKLDDDGDEGIECGGGFFRIEICIWVNWKHRALEVFLFVVLYYCLPAFLLLSSVRSYKMQLFFLVFYRS